ncbi:MAG: MBL fold metallo-hydrolase, partial [Proteobacteria bacterium]|nr:MBL fold metallo-hydrolase [Pseudomonadota bacterium]
DKNEMLRFLNESNLKIKRIAVVHGEEEQTLSFTDFLTQAGFSAFAPRPGDTIEIG